MAEAALSQGHELVLGVYGWPEVPPRIGAFEAQGVPVLRRSFPGGRRQDRLWRRVRPPLSQFFAHRPDVICISQGEVYTSVIRDEFLAQLYRSKLPYVVVCQLNQEAFGLPESLQGAAAQFLGRAERVVFVAEANRRLAERQLARSLPNAQVLRNPVNLAETGPLALPEDGLVKLVSVARLQVADKGQDLLLAALSDPLWQGRDWQLDFYGQGPDWAYLNRLAAFYGLTGRVEFRGQVTDIRSLWAAHHLLVLPSRNEGTPLSLVEAMLCGRPAVVSAVGGNPEWIEEGRSGWIAPAPQPEAVGAALERAWQGRESWPQFGLNAYQDALARYDPQPGHTLLKVLVEAARS